MTRSRPIVGRVERLGVENTPGRSPCPAISLSSEPTRSETVSGPLRLASRANASEHFHETFRAAATATRPFAGILSNGWTTQTAPTASIETPRVARCACGSPMRLVLDTLHKSITIPVLVCSLSLRPRGECEDPRARAIHARKVGST